MGPLLYCVGLTLRVNGEDSGGPSSGTLALWARLTTWR